MKTNLLATLCLIIAMGCNSPTAPDSAHLVVTGQHTAMSVMIHVEAFDGAETINPEPCQISIGKTDVAADAMPYGLVPFVDGKLDFSATGMWTYPIWIFAESEWEGEPISGVLKLD